jgi:hypothetical protein
MKKEKWNLYHSVTVQKRNMTCSLHFWSKIHEYNEYTQFNIITLKKSGCLGFQYKQALLYKFWYLAWQKNLFNILLFAALGDRYWCALKLGMCFNIFNFSLLKVIRWNFRSSIFHLAWSAPSMHVCDMFPQTLWILWYLVTNVASERTLQFTM